MNILGFQITKNTYKDPFTAVNRATVENQQYYEYNQFWVNPKIHQTILDIRHMDREDTRVKKIHGRMSRAAVKGGLMLETASNNKIISTKWREFANRTGLNKRAKLESDARGLLIEGTLALEVAVNNSMQVAGLVRMPAETIKPLVAKSGGISDATKAFEQWDLTNNTVIVSFALWQIALVRLTPDNYDDLGAMGRPYLDSARGVWQKLTMTEQDLVIRRRHRAPMRMSHVLKGATDEELDKYEAKNKFKTGNIITDFFSNKDGSVLSVSGDANLDQIADVSYLLDTFFAGSPAPKGLFGYADGLSRDILEDLKRDFFDELDSLQDTLAEAYQQAFATELLLSGIDPDGFDFQVMFAERKTETLNQAADRALKLQALGYSRETCIRITGGDPVKEQALRESETDLFDPYPEPKTKHKVSITSGNAKKGESATDINNG